MKDRITEMKADPKYRLHIPFLRSIEDEAENGSTDEETLLAHLAALDANIEEGNYTDKGEPPYGWLVQEELYGMGVNLFFARLVAERMREEEARLYKADAKENIDDITAQIRFLTDNFARLVVVGEGKRFSGGQFDHLTPYGTIGELLQRATDVFWGIDEAEAQRSRIDELDERLNWYAVQDLDAIGEELHNMITESE